jgi:serine/threonine protein kinase/tetratricopeptide (TPR) repeat protein
MPAADGEFAGFRLVSELGRGAFGRVYLARQSALADRPVVLKVAPDVGSESQALAQLQHTHIVPIYSVHRTGAVHAICMPYCGCATLADVLRGLRALPALPAAGPDLLGPLADKPRPAGVAAPEGPSVAVRETLAGLDYASAVLWLGARLASGLAHAHERGILHRDIKPANVLLTDEGLPMLLDFNIASDVKVAAAAAMIGGTLPYMAPEHLAALKGGQDPVDARSDVYSLGIVLFELLTGRFPFQARRLDDRPGAMQELLARMVEERVSRPPCPREHNGAVSPAAASIVRHCLEPNPRRRYPSAKALHEDIERHLRHEPLRHAPEPSLRERFRKWVRRNPRLPRRLTVTALLLLATLVAGFASRAVLLDRARRAQRTLAEFRTELRQAQFLLLVPVASADERRQGEASARRGLGLYGVPDDPDWQARPLLTALPPDDRAELRGEVGELLLLLARRCAEKGGDKGEADALKYNALAEACFDAEDAPKMIWEQRSKLLERSDPAGAKEAAAHAETIPTRSVRDRYLKGRELILKGRYKEAQAALARAAREGPDSYPTLFLMAIAHEGMGQEAEACRWYTVCIGLMPDFYGPYWARGSSYLRQKRWDAAKADFDTVIALVPERPQTYYDRAIALQWLNDERGKPRRQDALADLGRAQAKGLDQTRLYFFRARLRRAEGDEKGAKADLEQGLELTPTDDRSWVARGIAQMKDHPQRAIADFDKALKHNPSSQDALMSKAHVLAEQLGRQEDARAVLARLLEMYPDHAGALAGQAVVLARMKERDEALDHIDRALERDRGGLTLYQAVCVYALTSRVQADDADTAAYYLRRALNGGFGWDFLEKDPDLKAIRDTPAFAKLTRLAALLREKNPPPRSLRRPHAD